MRNLKRVLSLAMALVMVLGMMVITTNAADFTDAEEITYKEAVEVMAEIGILKGMGDGTFAPKGTLTRAQAAKIIAFVMMGADADTYLTGSASAFEDVAADDWAAKYVAFCKNAKIIDGVNAEKTLFNPAGTLTTVQFGKMILNALEIEGTYTGAGWENNVRKALEEAELDVITIDSSEITREEACEMALAAMKYTSEASGYVVKKGATVLKKFAEITDAIIYCATLKTADQANAADYTYDVAPATSYLLNTTYGVTCGDSVDTFGRPGIRYTKGNSINLFFTDEPAFTFVNSFTKEVADEMAEAGYVLADNTIIYNGYTTTPDEINTVAELYSAAQGNPAVNGYTIEMYNTDDNAKTIEKIVVIESNFAVVKEVEETEGTTAGSVVLTVYWNRNTTDVTYTDDLTKTNDQYDALVGYAEGTALVVTLAQDWAASTPAKLLSVTVPTAVPGTIAKKFVGTKYTTCTLTIADETYALNNNFSHAMGSSGLMPGDEGTLYLDAQGKAIGWVAKAGPNTPAETLVYVVGTYARPTFVVNEFTSGTAYTYWAQCVTMDGEVVTYQIVKGGSTFTETTPGKIQAVKVASAKDANNGNLKADYATFTDPVQASGAVKDLTVGQDGVSKNAVKIADKEYYTADVKFVYVYGHKDTLDVVAVAGAQALAKDDVVTYVAKTATGATNATVSTVFVELTSKYVAPTEKVTVEGVIFAQEANDSKSAVLYVDADGNNQIGYEHTVYVDGVKTTIVTNDKAKLEGFITLEEVVEGVWKAAADTTSENLFTGVAVENMYKGMITTSGGIALEDVDVTGVTVINLTANTKAPTDATKLTTEYTLALVMDEEIESVVTIYLTGYSALS